MVITWIERQKSNIKTILTGRDFAYILIWIVKVSINDNSIKSIKFTFKTSLLFLKKQIK